jgi:hypothetical protein
LEAQIDAPTNRLANPALYQQKMPANSSAQWENPDNIHQQIDQSLARWESWKSYESAGRVGSLSLQAVAPSAKQPTWKRRIENAKALK